MKDIGQKVNYSGSGPVLSENQVQAEEFDPINNEIRTTLLTVGASFDSEKKNQMLSGVGQFLQETNDAPYCVPATIQGIEQVTSEIVNSPGILNADHSRFQIVPTFFSSDPVRSGIKFFTFEDVSNAYDAYNNQETYWKYGTKRSSYIYIDKNNKLVFQEDVKSLMSDDDINYFDSHFVNDFDVVEGRVLGGSILNRQGINGIRIIYTGFNDGNPNIPTITVKDVLLHSIVGPDGIEVLNLASGGDKCGYVSGVLTESGVGDNLAGISVYYDFAQESSTTYNIMKINILTPFGSQTAVPSSPSVFKSNAIMPQKINDGIIYYDLSTSKFKINATFGSYTPDQDLPEQPVPRFSDTIDEYFPQPPDIFYKSFCAVFSQSNVSNGVYDIGSEIFLVSEKEYDAQLPYTNAGYDGAQSQGAQIISLISENGSTSTIGIYGGFFVFFGIHKNKIILGRLANFSETGSLYGYGFCPSKVWSLQLPRSFSSVFSANYKDRNFVKSWQLL